MIYNSLLVRFWFYILLLHRDNEQRLKKLGKSLSVESKQYRAKRINVNVKINGLGYFAEILGGFLMLLTTFHHKVSIQNTVALFWMGNFIPSCYLINFVHHKRGIMNDGWISTISQLYRKKDVKWGENEKITLNWQEWMPSNAELRN